MHKREIKDKIDHEYTGKNVYCACAKLKVVHMRKMEIKDKIDHEYTGKDVYCACAKLNYCTCARGRLRTRLTMSIHVNMSTAHAQN
jgi:hypothetical protein